jgi:hypothetical protein
MPVAPAQVQVDGLLFAGGRRNLAGLGADGAILEPVSVHKRQVFEIICGIAVLTTARPGGFG